MKIHSGADAGTGYVHTITATAANVHDIAKAHALIREDNHAAYGDSGYLGVEKRMEIRENHDLSGVDYCIAQRPSQNRMTKAYKGTNWERQIEHAKASVRSKVVRPFLIVKRLFHAGSQSWRPLWIPLWLRSRCPRLLTLPPAPKARHSLHCPCTVHHALLPP